MIDLFGRAITYLRVSVTDRCNVRCVYCMPPEGVTWRPHSSILRYEEIAQVVRVAAEQGVRKVRLTGGEPLVRPNLAALVRMIADIPGIEDISLTTNGLLFASMASTLADAGLKRVNISLDTLKPARFERITRGGSFDQVIKGIAAAESAGLKPLKINAVMVRGFNDDEIEDLARLSIDRGWHVRFIELMPIQMQASWGADLPDPQTAFISNTEMLERLLPLGLKAIPQKMGDGPAQEYQLPGASGHIGFISPLSDDGFCARCNRMRLTADGHLRPCLMSDSEVPILEAIRRGEPLLPYWQRAISLKQPGHELNHRRPITGRCMTEIGG
jgi:cyclic pyranopterin phosphate synthase